MRDPLAERPDAIAYNVCRGEKNNGSLRYDLTKIRAELFGRELPKTAGHYHSAGMAEMFEVLEGRSYSLMQKNGDGAGNIAEAYLVEAEAGDSIVILPDFGFCTINAGKDSDLIVSNWIDVSVQNIYEDIRKFKGLCYYALSGDGKMSFEKNENYREVPALVRLRPKPLPEELRDLKFLSQPEKYSDFLTVDKLYEVI